MTLTVNTNPLTKAPIPAHQVGEDQLTELVHELDKKTYVRIANQQITVTDQLRVGIRMIELDVRVDVRNLL
jgi:hypothetical protein